MKIAITLFKYNPYGGYERQAALLAETLAKRGDDVTVFTSKWTGDGETVQYSGGGAVRLRKVAVRKLTSWIKLLSFGKFLSIHIERVEAAEGPFDCIVAFDRTLVMDIYRAGNACHREWLNFRKKYGTLRDKISININPLNLLILTLEQGIFTDEHTGKTNIIVLAKKGAEEIKRHYPLGDDRFTVIPPAVDFAGRFEKTEREAARKEIRAELGVPCDALLLLHVGSGFRIKGLRSTIGALARLTDKTAHLAVVGSDRKETARLARLSASLGVRNRVHFVGGTNDVGPSYAAADLFVRPSLIETFGAVFVEALWWGLPVIAGRGAGAAGLIEDKKVGSVIAVPADEADLARLIEDAASKEATLASSGKLDEEHARRREAAMECSLDSVMEKFLKLIDETAEAKLGNP